jgi:hypothetical protein
LLGHKKKQLGETHCLKKTQTAAVVEIQGEKVGEKLKCEGKFISRGNPIFLEKTKLIRLLGQRLNTLQQPAQPFLWHKQLRDNLVCMRAT